MARYTKIPVTVEAEQWTGENLLDICRLTSRCGGELKGEAGTLKIKTLEGTMTAQPGDYIIKGVAGECYPCKPDIFAKTYCEVGDTYDLARLRELVEADREGRCVVLRFAPGSTVYRTWVHPGNGKMFITEHHMDSVKNCVEAELWNGAYSTREAALKGRE